MRTEIEERDVLLIALCAIGGFALVICATHSLLLSAIAGVPSGAGGGVVACLIRRRLRQ